MTSLLLSEPTLFAIASLLGLLILSATALRGWQGWLALKERELDVHHHRAPAAASAPSGAARIEIADLKERIRKLEAIASGVDL